MTLADAIVWRMQNRLYSDICHGKMEIEDINDRIIEIMRVEAAFKGELDEFEQWYRTMKETEYETI